MAGMFVLTVVMSACRLLDALAPQSSVAAGGVHVAVASTLPWQLAWHCAFVWQDGGVISPSHCGAVPVVVHPPRQRTFAPQLTIAPAWILHSPVHVPLQTPAQ
jgi:hypothetical protein